MTEIVAPPEGWEILEVEGDPDVIDPGEFLFQGPDGEVLSYAAMLDQGLIETPTDEAEPLEEAASQHTGIMVALYPPSAQAQALAIKGGEDADELHMTLCFLGKTDQLGTDPTEAISAVRRWAAAVPELKGEISGTGHFAGNPDSDDGTVTYLSLDLPELPHNREALVSMLKAAGLPPLMNHGFTPHMTLAYGNRRPTIDLPQDITFDRVVLAWGDEQFSFPLSCEDCP